MPGENVIEALGREFPMHRELALILKVPADVREIGAHSFSSDSTPASSFEGCFRLGLPFPENVPDYAIGLVRGNCILVDRGRGIIVMGEVNKESGWAGFEINLRRALEISPPEGSLLILGDDVEKVI
jgi:hypothetical protein